MLETAQKLSGFPGFFDNFPQILVLIVAWLIVLVAFFVLAVQLFVTLIEFKLTALAGFVLVPFGLFGKTAFLAERVLGNVVGTGVKVLVLAVIVGIGSGLFGEFAQDFGGQQPSLEEVLSLALASLCLLGLGIFGPAIANGLVSGAPQLAAGAAVGTGAAAGGLAVAGALGGRALASGAAGGVRAALSIVRGSRPDPAGSGDTGLRPGPTAPGGGGASSPPAWARDYQRRQDAAHAATTAAHAVRLGDHPGGGTSVSLTEDRS